MASSSSSSSYESFIAAHMSAIGTVESSIRSLTWFLPWFRFKEADLASESLTSLLNLTSLYHDILIARKLAQPKPKSLSSILQSDHARFVSNDTQRHDMSSSYRTQVHSCLELDELNIQVCGTNIGDFSLHATGAGNGAASSESQPCSSKSYCQS